MYDRPVRTSLSGVLFLGLVTVGCGRTGLAPGQSEGGSGQGGDGGGGAAPGCGNAVVDAGEGCDDGNKLDTDSCVVGCKAARCGDGFVRAGVEACDDGNLDDGDACTNGCALPTCGNGILNPGEDCDDANANDTDGCLSTCLFAFCGDGFVWAGFEPCDDGNVSNNDSCLVGCAPAFCGDGFVWTGVEPCDDGNGNDFDGCRNNCSLPSCGDGILDPGEGCDDGNNNNFDGCHNNCTLPFCGDGVVDPGEGCDDGNGSNTDACVAGCTPAACGDGFVWAGIEECDDGNLNPNDGCSPMCTLPICGDGIVEVGEACDLGAGNADRPALEIEQVALLQGVVPFDNPEDGSIFYSYFSASGHTGFEAPFTSRMYFYRDTTSELLSLFMHHHIDAQVCPVTNVDFTFTGVPSSVLVSLADDTPGELFKQSATTVIGNWTFETNTDGGVLSGFPLPGSWEVTLVPQFGPSVSAFQFMDGTTAFSPLNLNDDLILRAYPTPSACRTDCTVPFCGDGIMDGGEVCDDGNNVGGDGCAGDCSSLGG